MIKTDVWRWILVAKPAIDKFNYCTQFEKTNKHSYKNSNWSNIEIMVVKICAIDCWIQNVRITIYFPSIGENLFFLVSRKIEQKMFIYGKHFKYN